MINFIDWFDITNIYHLKAYSHLQKFGSWPKDFIPDNVNMTLSWSIQLAYKMANAWVKQWVKE